jgi:hypothetical protein
MDKYTPNIPILSFWKQNTAMPHLRRFAKFLLSIPASSSSFDRVFSFVDRNHCKERPQLSQETISNLVMNHAITNFSNIETEE